MKMQHVKTNHFGESAPAIRYEGTDYALADYMGDMVGTLRLAFFDEKKKQYGLLIDDECGWYHWMPVEYEDWLDVRACAFSHPGAKLFFRTSYGKKHGKVKIHKLGWFPAKTREDGSAQNSSEQGTCTASSVPPTGSAAALGVTPNTPESEVSK